MFRFPPDPEECRQWISALPNSNLKSATLTKYMGICAKHWPPNAPKIFWGIYLLPLPPSCFSSNITASIPSNSTKPRSTVKALSSARVFDFDETDIFLKSDRFQEYALGDFDNLFQEKLSAKGEVTYKQGAEYIVRSHNKGGPIFEYVVIFYLKLVW